jgi:hypothetical protein
VTERMAWREWQATATPAMRYAAHLSMWRVRRNRERSKWGQGGGRTMDRMFDLTHFERRSMEAHRRLGRWR